MFSWSLSIRPCSVVRFSLKPSEAETPDSSYVAPHSRGITHRPRSPRRSSLTRAMPPPHGGATQACHSRGARVRPTPLQWKNGVTEVCTAAEDGWRFLPFGAKLGSPTACKRGSTHCAICLFALWGEPPPNHPYPASVPRKGVIFLNQHKILTRCCPCRHHESYKLMIEIMKITVNFQWIAEDF